MGRPRKEVSLVKLFRVPRVLSMDQLCEKMKCSKQTVFRRLYEHGYYSSYNYAGRFFTIDEVSHYDSYGLWTCKGARFSNHGTLKQTVAHFVKTSKQGMIHEELSGLLAVRTQNTLLTLFEEGIIHREKIGPAFVYLSPKQSLRKKQMLQRQKLIKTQKRPCPTYPQKIATLLELVMDPKVERQEIVARVKRKGVSISREVVNVIFEKYELDKKRAL
jgi:hypothetical protein